MPWKAFATTVEQSVLPVIFFSGVLLSRCPFKGTVLGVFSLTWVSSFTLFGTTR